MYYYRYIMSAQIALSRLGGDLRQMRTLRGLTQAEVALRAGLPRLKVIQAEAGKPTVSVAAYASIAGALGGEVSVVPARRPTLDEIDALLK
jgi:transcriptional regulator with XRE-family HTH domain